MPVQTETPRKEFELGRHRIVAPGEMLRSGPDGKRRLEDSVFENIGPAFTNDQQRAGLTVFSPDLRQEAYEARTQEYLRTIENLIGLKRGLLSDAQEVEKTAFEIASTEMCIRDRPAGPRWSCWLPPAGPSRSSAPWIWPQNQLSP